MLLATALPQFLTALDTAQTRLQVAYKLAEQPEICSELIHLYRRFHREQRFFDYLAPRVILPVSRNSVVSESLWRWHHVLRMLRATRSEMQALAAQLSERHGIHCGVSILVAGGGELYITPNVHSAVSKLQEFRREVVLKAAISGQPIPAELVGYDAVAHAYIEEVEGPTERADFMLTCGDL